MGRVRVHGSMHEGEGMGVVVRETKGDEIVLSVMGMGLVDLR